ncbi:MAG TPA: tetratricopeptide repeat protein, partial [Geobacteraceae bacterium]|nr:tetratricopeptide repeat protein [Geobacteraceae bacterium]
MRKIVLYIMMAALTTGFTWGKSSSEKCEEAKQLALGIVSTTARESMLKPVDSIRELCPDGAAGQFINGYGFEIVGNLVRAMHSYKEALRIDPDFAPASGRLGLIYLETGNEEDATLELTRAIRSHQDPLYHKALARIFRSRKLFSLAIQHNYEAVKLSPSDATLLSALAETYKEAGQVDKAEEAYRRAASLKPGDIDSLKGLASAYISTGQYDKALETLRKAEAAAPLDKDVHRLKAETYLKKGD